MKIAFIVGQFPALSETFILNQITGLIDKGHEVDIFSGSAGAGNKHHPEIKQYALPNRTRYYPSFPGNPMQRLLKGCCLATKFLLINPWAVWQALNVTVYGQFATSLRLLYALEPFIGDSRSYDVIHCHFGGNGLRAVFLRNAGLINGPIVTTFHGADIAVAIKKYGRRVYDPLLFSGDLFLPISERWERELLALGAPAERVRVHHMGVDCSAPARRYDKNKTPRLISVCRLAEKKGIEYAIRAVATLPASVANIHYDIVGEGPLKQQLEELADELGVKAKLTFHGALDKLEVQRLLLQADIFIQPSVTAHNGDQEGIPVSIMEAMAHGLPVLSTQHSGIPELVRDGVSGLLAPERDVTALAEGLKRLITESTVRRQMGAEARRTVQDNYNIKRLNDQLVVLYRSVAGNDRERDQ